MPSGGGIHSIKTMIDRSHDLPIARQPKALGVARSTVYYKPRPVSASVFSPLIAAKATFALNAGECVRRLFFVIECS
jgi:hypothetical protein